jgi:hypothetical protein
VSVPPGSKTQANRHEGSPGTWEVCRLLRCLYRYGCRRTTKPQALRECVSYRGERMDETRCRYRSANAMSRRDGRQKSECPRSTSAAGEPTRGSPSRGRRAPCRRTVGGKHGGDIEPRLGFACEEDARRVLEVLPKRFGKYGLAVHPDKTRLVPFESPERRDRDSQEPGGRPGTFDFLGFTLRWGISRRGKAVIVRQTAASRF